MNQEEKRSIRMMLRKGMTIPQIYNQTKFTVGQIMSAPFAWFTYFAGEITLYKTKDDFKAIQKQTIHALKDLRPIEDLIKIPQLEINKYWQRHGFIGNALEDSAIPFRLIDSLASIYEDLTNTESIDPAQKDNEKIERRREQREVVKAELSKLIENCTFYTLTISTADDELEERHDTLASAEDRATTFMRNHEKAYERDSIIACYRRHDALITGNCIAAFRTRQGDCVRI